MSTTDNRTTIRTAISLDRALFDQLQDLASERGVSRTEVIVGALRAFLTQEENHRLLDQINAAYAENDPAEDIQPKRTDTKALRRNHLSIVGREEW